MTTLMILGALEEFIPLAALAKKRGLRTVVVDGNADAPAKLLASISYTVDVRDIDAIADIAQKERVDAITTAYSDLLLECMVNIADRAKLPCHLTPTQLPFYRDKHVINQTCEKLHLPTPKSTVLCSDFSENDLSALAFPMVIKPLDLYGSRGLFIVHSTNAIRQHFKDSLTSSHAQELLAEEYNPDHEFNIQCWVLDGKVHVLGIADREKTSFDSTTVPLSTRNIYPSRLISHVYHEAGQALTAYIRHTGQKEGPLSMQFYWSQERGFQIGEIAARFLGYEHELLDFSSNIKVEELLLAQAMNDKNELRRLLAQTEPFGTCSAAVVYFHANDGIAEDLSRLSAASKMNGVVQSQIFYQKGERIGSPQRMPYAARFDLVAKTRREVDALSLDLISQASMTDTLGNELLKKGIPGSYPEDCL